MLAARTAAIATRAVARSQPSKVGQKRTFINYLVNYPDRVQEIKKIQMKGGTCQGEANPTWLKQPGDVGVAMVGAGLVAFGTINCMIGHYRLATGKGKLD